MKSVIIALVLFPLLSTAQKIKMDSVWRPFEPFIGTWTGTGEGVDGIGTYERTYQFVLNKKYIEIKNKTVYPVTKENPKGYIHQDVGYISYDKIRKTFVFRQFHGEGFVNQYKLDSLSADKKTVVFVSEAFENMPAGWRARETYTITQNTLTEFFNLAEPGKDFTPYTQAILKKKSE
jgi:hypothetical protein